MDNVVHIVAIVISVLIALAAAGALVLLVVRAFQSSRIEQQTVANGQEVAKTIREIDTTLHQICDRMTNSTQLARDNQEDLRRMIHDVTTMIGKVESRLSKDIEDNRDWVAMQFGKHGGTNVNVGETRGVQVGDDNRQL